MLRRLEALCHFRLHFQNIFISDPIQKEMNSNEFFEIIISPPASEAQKERLIFKLSLKLCFYVQDADVMQVPAVNRSQYSASLLIVLDRAGC